MITAIAILMMVAGAAAIVAPNGVARLFRRLSGRGPAAAYFYFDPETVRSSRKVRVGYAFVGCAFVMSGLAIAMTRQPAR